MNINDLDLDALFAEAVNTIKPHVTVLEGIARWDAGDIGAYWLTVAERNARPPRIVIEMTAKTARAESGFSDECDGTAFPVPAAMEAAEALAQKHGLSVKWEPCEKGWGSFWFEQA